MSTDSTADPDLSRNLANAKSLVPLGSTWVHRRGEQYYIVGHCAVAGYKTVAVLCRGEDGIVWCRPADQFLGGRLIRIDEGQPESAQTGTKPHDVTITDESISDWN